MRQITVELLVSHQKLIADVSRKMALRLNYRDPEELESFGRSVLIEKAHRWDPSRGKFTTFAVWVLRNAMMDYVKRARRLVPMSEAVGDDGEAVNWIENQPDPKAPEALPSRMSELYEAVSESAREVLSVLASTDFGDVFGRGKTPPLERVRALLIARGWDRRRTHRALKEIGGYVRSW